MTIEKIKEIAHEKFGMDMTDVMAQKYMEKYADKLGKPSDNELDYVSGGYGACDKEYREGKYCEPCGVWCDHHTGFEDDTIASLYGLLGPMHESMICPKCGTIYS